MLVNSFGTRGSEAIYTLVARRIKCDDNKTDIVHMDKKEENSLIQLKLVNHFMHKTWSARRSQGQPAACFIIDFGLAFVFFWWPLLISAHVAASYLVQNLLLFRVSECECVCEPRECHLSSFVHCSSSSLNWI